MYILRPPLYYAVDAFSTTIITHDDRDMLKRQRPPTPPPSSLGDPPSFLPNGYPIRSLPSLHTTDLSQPRFKRQRTQPPPLDGTLRGWPKPPGSQWESDGEEDLTEDSHSLPGSPLPPSMTVGQYKDANNLLHELHILNQRRLLFAYPPRYQPLNPNPGVLLPAAHTHAQEPQVGNRPTPWTHTPPRHSATQQSTPDELEGRGYHIGSVEEMGLVEEVQSVQQRYEGANRFLGSLFLSRRREVKEVMSSSNPGPSS